MRNHVVMSLLLLTTFVGLRAFAYEKEIKTTAATIADSIARSSKKTIAVVDFTDLQGRVTELGRFLAEEFSVAIAGMGKGFEVVDRTHLKVILAEHKLTSTGIIDPATARKLGEIAGVEVLVTGTITPFGDSVRLTVKGLDSATAKAILAAATDIPKTKAIEELLAKGIQDPAQNSGATGSARPGKPRAHVGSKSPGARATVGKAQAKNLSLELVSCQAQGQRVSCGVVITATDFSRRLYLYSKGNDPTSRAIDESGYQYLAAQILLGSAPGRRAGRRSRVTMRLAPDAPIRATLVFEEVPPGVTAFAAFVLSGHFMESFQAVFRNVPVLR